MVIGEIVEQFVGLAIQHAIALLNGGLSIFKSILFFTFLFSSFNTSCSNKLLRTMQKTTLICFSGHFFI